MAYTNAIVGWADPNTGIPYAPGVRVHPTPIYEFLLGVFVFGILWSLRKKKFAPGTLAWLYLILAGLTRFVVEFWRINPAIGFGFSEAQWFSLILMIVGLFLALGPAGASANVGVFSFHPLDLRSNSNHIDSSTIEVLQTKDEHATLVRAL